MRGLAICYQMGKKSLSQRYRFIIFFSLTANCLYLSKMGGLNVLITNPRDIPSMLKDMAKFKFTVITGSEYIIQCAIESSGFCKTRF